MTSEIRGRSGSLAGHVLKRLFLVAFGYLVAVLVGLLAIVAIYSILSYLPGAPGYFTTVSMTPIAMLFVPPFWIFTISIAIVVTGPPALVAILACEIFSLRSIWLNMVFGSVCAVLGYTMLAAFLPDTGVIAGAGLVGGFVYWLIAGRDAGFGRSA